MESSKASTSNDKENNVENAGGSQATPLYTKEQAEFVQRILSTKNSRVILGLPATDTEMGIRKAFQDRSQKVHPSNNKAPGASAAYEALEKAYNSCLKIAQEGNGVYRDEDYIQQLLDTEERMRVEVYDDLVAQMKQRGPDDLYDYHAELM